MHNNRYDNPYLIERIVSALSYVTSGLVGFVWLLLGVFTKSNVRPFLKYHIFQSIFLAMAYILLTYLIGMLSSIVNFIPYLRTVISIILFPLMMPIFFGFSIIQILIYTLIFYLVVTSLMGRYSYLPWISNLIKSYIRH